MTVYHGTEELAEQAFVQIAQLIDRLFAAQENAHGEHAAPQRESRPDPAIATG
ncbi:MAG: hypothetical protein RIB45_03915 [Marivibrio sp.]|uniref:hypothetical protein n=1 Tax=Marivibrio sp. TaxID=2039719 RepID=UPI0032ED027E